MLLNIKFLFVALYRLFNKLNSYKVNSNNLMTQYEKRGYYLFSFRAIHQQIQRKTQNKRIKIKK